MATIEITKENFAETIKNGIVLLDFWASWCGPCRKFGPIFEAASEEYQDLTFGKVDTEAQRELAQEHGIMSIPTVMIFRDGIKLFEGAGALSQNALADLIAQAKSLNMEEVRTQAEKQ